MTRTRSPQANTQTLQLLRPAGGWLLVLMVLTLALPTAWSFVPGPPGREIQLEPATTGFGAELPSILIETTSQAKQASPKLETLLFTSDGGLAPPPADAVLSQAAEPATLPRTTPRSFSFSARPPPSV